MTSDMQHGDEQTARAVALVRRFFDRIDATPDGYWRCFEEYFDDSTIWETVGPGTTVGREAAINVAKAFPVTFERMRIEGLVLSGARRPVHAERLDHFCAHEGSIVLSIPRARRLRGRWRED